MTDNTRSDAWETLRGKHAEIREVPLDSIEIDKRFQRALNERRVDAIKNEYHPQGIGLIVVAHVNGDDLDTWACIDGQTRVVALQGLRDEIREVDGEGAEAAPTSVQAEVYDDLTAEEAALLFRLRNFQTAVPVQERHRIALTEGDPDMVEVLRQVELAGFTLFANDGQPATMPHIDVGKRIIRWARKYGRPDLLAESLTIQANAFGTDVGAVDRVVLQATANLLRKNAQLDEEQLTDLLRGRGVPKILGEAQAIRQQLNMRQAKATEFYLVREYNALKGVSEKIRH